MDELIKKVLEEEKIVRYIPTFVKVLTRYRKYLLENQSQHETQVMPPPKAKSNNILKVVIQLGGIEVEDDEPYFLPNFVRHIELTEINDIKFNRDTLKELGRQFTMTIKQLTADYERSA